MSITRFEHGTAPLPNWLEEHELSLDDDRNSIRPGEAVLLIVEDDPTFAQVLMDTAHERGLKAWSPLCGALRRSPWPERSSPMQLRWTSACRT